MIEKPQYIRAKQHLADPANPDFAPRNDMERRAIKTVKGQRSYNESKQRAHDLVSAKVAGEPVQVTREYSIKPVWISTTATKVFRVRHLDRTVETFDTMEAAHEHIMNLTNDGEVDVS